MYIWPKPHKCQKCDHTFQWGPHDYHGAPVFTNDDGKDQPVCPKCWEAFIRENCGIGSPTNEKL